jgi:ubiquinone/menaquinone biosynthesis C-methylase UbiE
MQDTDKDFIGSVPEFYDRLLGKILFEDYARDLAQRIRAAAPSTLLELAAGTGISSREICNALPSTKMTVTDLNEPMLEIATQKFNSDETIEFQAVDAMATPFDDESFDLIACQFGVMFFPDKIASFREARRLVKPGGRYIFSAWGAMESNPFAAAANACAIRFFPDNPPGFYKAPFSYPDPDRVRDDLTAAGWTDIESDVVNIRHTAVDFQAFAQGLTYGNPIKAEIDARGGVDPDDFVASLAESLEQACVELGGELPLSATVYSARKP